MDYTNLIIFMLIRLLVHYEVIFSSFFRNTSPNMQIKELKANCKNYQTATLNPSHKRIKIYVPLNY